jgi:uncharacterized repeat protein (TIGR04052 family)
MKNSLIWAAMASSVISLTACSDDMSEDFGPSTPDSGAVDGKVDGKVDAGLDGSLSPMDGAVLDSAAPAADAGDQFALTLRFKAKVLDQDLVCGRSYNNVGSTGVSVTPRDFRIFVQEVRLITRDGREVPVALDTRDKFQAPQVALLDFANAEGSCNAASPETNTIITGRAPVGDYTGLVFVNGVAEALNHADPTLSPAPLQAPGASWGWTAGYRFLMAEVLTTSSHGADAGAHGDDAGAGHGAAPAGLGFVHLGSTACSGTPASGIQCERPNRSEVRLTGFDPLTSTIVADLAAVFSTADLSTEVQCHGSGTACAPMFDALGVNLETGATLTTQRVYRVE